MYLNISQDNDTSPEVGVWDDLFRWASQSTVGRLSAAAMNKLERGELHSAETSADRLNNQEKTK